MARPPRPTADAVAPPAASEHNSHAATHASQPPFETPRACKRHTTLLRRRPSPLACNTRTAAPSPDRRPLLHFGGRVPCKSRSINREWWSIRFRLHVCTCGASPCGPSVRAGVDKLTKSRDLRTRELGVDSTALFDAQLGLCHAVAVHGEECHAAPCPAHHLDTESDKSVAAAAAAAAARHSTTRRQSGLAWCRGVVVSWCRVLRCGVVWRGVVWRGRHRW